MSARSEWSVTEPRTLEIEEPVRELDVRVVSGTVNVVGVPAGSVPGSGAARVEVTALHGPPLTVSCRDGVLSVGYKDLPWKGWLDFGKLKGWRRTAVVSVTVPAATGVRVGVVGAGAVISGISGRTQLNGVSGGSTLVGLTGPVRAETVSGDVQAQAVTGDLRFSSVSGDLTVVDGAGASVRAESVSGDMVLDLDLPPAAGPGGTGRTDVKLTTVSGEVAIRLPDPADAQVDAQVEANTTSGTVANAFEDLRVSGQWGAKRITGRLGAGNGRLEVTTVSGGLALLRRPPSHDGPVRHGDTDETPADKKVL
ncbi:DUF4097 domain-containing protein [Streptomyces sp. MST-110588]|uniref:DUF4097 family beta strand repeat-containing protein n=1 Tax=Streptomyces sp. MST-110588 TaxID=2833628 RepID=UPI001F5CFC21|nr:DUF4097 domain-containing protein [Streptomyces sp. MST-110588]UNO39969.1 hypothetical protein KGS77_10645 [Streptomyces sp. MST-110588]